MIIREIIAKISENDSKPKAKANPNFKRKVFGGLKGSEVLKIIGIAVQVQALEETITCITNQGFKGSSYKDLITTAANLDFSDKDFAALEVFNHHLPFFISAMVPPLLPVIVPNLSTNYFNMNHR